MPTFNEGIRTKAGDDLYSNVDSGQTKITYTRVVFSSLDLSTNSDDEIAKMTDIEPQELSTKPQVINQKTNHETEIRAIVENKPLSQGLFIRTYGVYAKGDNSPEILYGVSVDDHPSYLPAYVADSRPQAITFNWDTSISDTNDVHFTDTNDAYVSYKDFDDFSSSVSSRINSTANNSSVTDTIAKSTSTLSASAAEGIASNANGITHLSGSYHNTLNRMVFDNLDGTITVNNKRITPGNDSSINSSIAKALNQANAYTDNNIRTINYPINKPKNINLVSMTTYTRLDKDNGHKVMHIPVVKGKNYYFSMHAKQAPTPIRFNSTWNPVSQWGNVLNDSYNISTGQSCNGVWTATRTGTMPLTIINSKGNDNFIATKICVTQSDEYIPFEKAENYNDPSARNLPIIATSNAEDAKQKSTQFSNIVFIYPTPK